MGGVSDLKGWPDVHRRRAFTVGAGLEAAAALLRRDRAAQAQPHRPIHRLPLLQRRADDRPQPDSGAEGLRAVARTDPAYVERSGVDGRDAWHAADEKGRDRAAAADRAG